MPFKFELDIDPRAFDPTDDVLTKFNDIVFDALQTARAQVQPDMMQDLRRYPPKRKYPRDYPIEWTSERQRRAYFATNGFGKGIPYQRRGKLAASWYMYIRRDTDNSFQFVVLNRSGYARFVVGSMENDNEKAYSQIQRFHEITGWQKAKPIVNWYFEVFADAFEQELLKEINVIVRT